MTVEIVCSCSLCLELALNLDELCNLTSVTQGHNANSALWFSQNSFWFRWVFFTLEQTHVLQAWVHIGRTRIKMHVSTSSTQQSLLLWHVSWSEKGDGASQLTNNANSTYNTYTHTHTHRKQKQQQQIRHTRNCPLSIKSLLFTWKGLNQFGYQVHLATIYLKMQINKDTHKHTCSQCTHTNAPVSWVCSNIPLLLSCMIHCGSGEQ